MLIQYLFTNFQFFIWIMVIVILTTAVNAWAQCLVAYWQGDKQLKEQGYLTPNPLRFLKGPSLFCLLAAGITWSSLPIEPDNFRHKYGVAMVSGTGLLAFLFLMGISGLSMFLLVANSQEPASPVALNCLKFLKLAAFINAGFFLFNILPIPPFGGYRIINNLFPFTARLYEPLKKYSLILLLLLIFFPGSMDVLWKSAATLSHENLMFWSRLLSF